MRALSGRVFFGGGRAGRGGVAGFMRAEGGGSGGGGGHHINVTPLIDVVMVMIIFFLIVGKLAADQRADVDLPAGAALDASAQARALIVNVTERGEIVVFGEVVTVEGLDARLREGVARARRERTGTGLGGEDGVLHVQIRADRGLAYGRVEPVVRACARAGVERVTFVTEGVVGGGGGGVGVGGEG